MKKIFKLFISVGMICSLFTLSSCSKKQSSEPVKEEEQLETEEDGVIELAEGEDTFGE